MSIDEERKCKEDLQVRDVSFQSSQSSLDSYSRALSSTEHQTITDMYHILKTILNSINFN